MELPLPQPLLLDGATGTELQKRGMTQGECTEGWILDHPEALMDLQKAYLAAGSQVLTAPTFGANPALLSRFGLADQTAEYNRRLVALTRRVAGTAALVAGNLTGCGLALPPAGESTFEDLVGCYRVQAAALGEAGVDLYLIETMTSMAEARAAVLAVKEYDPERPVLVSFYCDDEGRTPDDTDVLAALIVMQGMGVAAFGLNCVNSSDMEEQLARLSPYAAIPLLAMPACEKPGDPRPAEYTAALAALGVRCFGGCCGTAPADIAALRDTLDGLSLPPFAPPDQDPDVIPCASGKEARFITPNVDVGEMLECTPDLLEDILEAEEQQPQGALKIGILEEDDLDLFIEHQYAVRDALCIWSDVPELLEAALRQFQGRAFWDSTSNLEPEFLAEMKKKYGLVLL